MRLWLLFILLIITNCSNNFKSVGIYNRTNTEILIEAKPNISYGALEKWIDIYKDSTGRGLLWQAGEINAIVIYPKRIRPDVDSLGIYIMKPNSGFRIGTFYKPEDREFDYKTLNLDYLKICTPKDTTTLTTKQEIWKSLNYNRKNKRIKGIMHDRAIVVQ